MTCYSGIKVCKGILIGVGVTVVYVCVSDAGTCKGLICERKTVWVINIFLVGFHWQAIKMI